MNPVSLVALATVFGQLSLLAFGGANGILPEMHRQVVELRGWLDGREFVALYALAQAAPGPNLMVVSLIGWRIAGFGGAVVTMAAIALPASVLTLAVSGVWYRFRDKRWRRAVAAGLMPVTAGLIMAAAGVLVTEIVVSWLAIAVLVLCLPVFLLTKTHPLVILGSAAALGAIGAGA